MSENSLPELLPLREALIRFCDPDLVEALVTLQSDRTANELLEWEGPWLVDTSELMRPSPHGWMARPLNFTMLDGAWNVLVRDFCARLDRGQLFLQGIEVTADMAGQRQPLRGEFSARFKFDFKNNTVRFQGREFVSIRVSRAPLPESRTTLATASGDLALGPEEISRLNDAAILALLEAHAMRVVQSKDPHLIHPEKVTVMPIIRRKMEWRHEQGDLHHSLIEEARELAAWIKRALPSFQTPKAGSIKNAMSQRYKQLRA